MKIVRFAGVLAVSALVGLSASADPAEWPFITIRQTGGVLDHPEVLEKVAAINARHPGSCDEIWLSFPSWKSKDYYAQNLPKLTRLADILRKHGIKVGFQQGVSIGHRGGAFTNPQKGGWAFPEDAWEIGLDGKRQPYLCPRSPAAWEWQEYFAKEIMAASGTESYWLDDDMRMAGWRPDGCFCDRCLKAFAEEFGHVVSREELVKRIKEGDKPDVIRRDWLRFNERSLGIYAKALRRAADAANPACRLGLQTCNANELLAGSGYSEILSSCSGANRRPVGIRPGSGCYTEWTPRYWCGKWAAVARECERLRRSGLPVSSFAYEMETYPRLVLRKSPEAMMKECVGALASGCDGLTLYYFDNYTPEPLEYYEEFAQIVAEWRPYLRALGAISRKTHLGGAALYRGENADAMKEQSLSHPIVNELVWIGVPYTVAEADPDAWILGRKTEGEMTDADRANPNYKRAVKDRNFGLDPCTQHRKEFLDELDAAAPDRMCVRVEKNCRVAVFPRITADRRTLAVTFINGSIGREMNVRVRIRRPAAGKLKWIQPMVSPADVEAEPGRGDEIVVTIPTLQAWGVGTLCFRDR